MSLPDLNVKTIYTDNVALTGTPPPAQGYQPVNGDVVLVQANTAGTENGPHTVNTGGAWSRHTDFDADADFVTNSRFYPTHGTLSGSEWYFANSETPELGVTTLNFQQRTHAQAVEPGSGLVRSENVLGMPTMPSVTEGIYSFPTIGINDEGSIFSVEPTQVFTSLLEGMRLAYVSANSLTVKAGRAYIPGDDVVAPLVDDFTFTAMSLAASTTYYVYFAYNDGDPAPEFSTQAPETTPYLGFAYVKGPDLTPDDTRRYLGKFTTDGSSNIIATSITSVQDASETQPGLIELATSAEGIAATDAVRGITPAVLKAVQDARRPLDAYVELTRTTDLNITDAVTEPILWNTETRDPRGWHTTAGNSERITPDSTGMYLVALYTLWTANATGRRVARITLNGTTEAQDVTIPPIGQTSTPQATVALVYVTVGDYISCEVFQSSGATLALSSLSSVTVARVN